MRGRVLISALLVLALLPIYSFGAICELNCRATVIAKPTAMSSMGGRSTDSVTMSGHAQHHPSRQSTRHQNVASAQPLAREKASQSCCPSNPTASSVSCGAQNQNTLQEPTSAPKSDSNPAVLQTFTSLPALVVQGPHRIDIAQTTVRHESPTALTLRI